MGFITAEILFFLLLVIFGGLPLDTAWLFPGIYLVCSLISAYFLFLREKEGRQKKKGGKIPSVGPSCSSIAFVPLHDTGPVVPAYDTFARNRRLRLRDGKLYLDG